MSWIESVTLITQIGKPRLEDERDIRNLTFPGASSDMRLSLIESKFPLRGPNTQKMASEDRSVEC